MADPHLSYPEAIVVGLLQGVTELFPVSSLGHGVLIPALIGGRWARDLNLTADKSPYLTFLVAVHVATAIALVVFFRRDWARIVVGLAISLRDRKITTPDQRLAWLLMVATVPVGLAGLALEHAVRTSLGKPVPASVFLILNGVVLATVERLRRRADAPGGRRGPVPVRVPARHPGHRRRRPAQTPRTGRTHRPRHPRPGPRRQPRRRHRRLPVAALPDPLLRNPHPQPIRRLLRGGRHRQSRLDHPRLTAAKIARRGDRRSGPGPRPCGLSTTRRQAPTSGQDAPVPPFFYDDLV